ncbi:HEXXH motif domain-containing protein [Streptomyces coeruleorubidus]|uniref:HEXXH motif domain-containing protein n=1 Tax=Streptomyces coeruleorubidus TaxID=116188 RepID=UPI0033F15469
MSSRNEPRLPSAPDEIREDPGDLHRLPVESFVQVATGGGDTRTLGLLRNGQKSKRLVLIRMVLEAVTADPASMGPLPSAHSAWRLLSRVQYEDPEAFDRVLLHPSTGVWAAHVLRRLRGVRSSDVALWAEAGYLHTLAAAAAVCAGVDFEIQVPVPDGGTLHLPSLGTVRLPCADSGGRPGVATVRGTGRGLGSAAVVSPRGACVLLPDSLKSPLAGWRPIPYIRASRGGYSLRFALDDTDAYASFVAGRVPVPQHTQSRNRWQALTEQAWEILVRSQPDTADALAALLCSLVPLEPVTRGEPYSVTSPESFGSAMIQLPTEATTLAVSLIHECQHIKLGALLDLVTLTREAGDAVHYAPWRRDPRPAAGLLQGAYAYLGIVSFWRRYHPTVSGREAYRARFAYALWRHSTLAAVDRLLASGELTDLGLWFVSHMRECLADWCEEPLPPRAEADAALVASDHLGMWRLHNIQPSPSEAMLLAECFKHGSPTGRPVAGDPVVRADVLPRERPVRSELVKLRWEDPDSFAWQYTHPESLGATPADIALIDGDFDTALRRYGRQIMTRPEESSPWIGLGLAARGRGDDSAAAALLGRPELVRAVYLRLAGGAGTADPCAVAEWIGGLHKEAVVTGAPPPHLK